MRAARDEALIRLDVEEEHQVAEVRGTTAVRESGVLGGEHRRERAERERRLLVRGLQRLGQHRGAHAPVGRRGGELFLELCEGLRQRALREDELGDGQETVLKRLATRAEQRGVWRSRCRRQLRWRSSRRVEGFVGHGRDAREAGRWRSVCGFAFFREGQFGHLVILSFCMRDRMRHVTARFHTCVIVGHNGLGYPLISRGLPTPVAADPDGAAVSAVLPSHGVTTGLDRPKKIRRTTEE
jgi:hypothetical protein